METVIKSRIPGIQSLINKSIVELEAELSRLGKPIASDTGVSSSTVYASFLHYIVCWFPIAVLPYLRSKKVMETDLCFCLEMIDLIFKRSFHLIKDYLAFYSNFQIFNHISSLFLLISNFDDSLSWTLSCFLITFIHKHMNGNAFRASFRKMDNLPYCG